MGFPRGPRRPVAPGPVRSRSPVFAVGQRVCIAVSAENGSRRVSLTDEAGQHTVASLSGGTEVAILAWRPGWAGAARYRVRATGSGDEGWLAVGDLDRTQSANRSDAAVPPSRGVDRPARLAPGHAGRPFGSRK